MKKQNKMKWDKQWMSHFMHRPHAKLDIVVAAILICFFGYLFLAFPVVRLGDTFQYENQFVTREPVYPLVIQLLRFLTPHYDKVLVFLQNAFTAVAIFVFWRFVRQEFCLNIVTSFVVLAGLLVQYILTPIMSESGLIMTNAILTEGFSIPLFLLFIMFLLKAVWYEQKRFQNQCISFGIAFVLSLIRGQMMVLLIAWAIIFGIQCLVKKKYIAIVKIALLIIIAFVGRSYTARIYNYLEQEYFVDTVSSKAMMLANVLYVSDREDGEVIADEGLRELFYEIYDTMEENGATYQYAESGLINRAMHSEHVHEDINFNYFTTANDAYLDRTRGINASDFMLLRITTDEVASALMAELLPEVLPKFIYNYIALAIVGFIRTVAVVHPLLNWYAIVAYLAAFVLCLVRLKQEKNSRAAKFMLITLLLICGTVFGTAMMIQCISRYMIYNFPIFYISGLLMLLECYEYNKKRGERDGL